jgi:hypothetical protein
VRESGPLATAIWRAAPMLEQVSPADLDDRGPAEGEACTRRVLAGGHLCLLCGKAATAAVVARPNAGPFMTAVWADLCGLCFWALDAEQHGP